jgi:DNA-binding NarL/FixJ family response regulator
MESSLMEPKRIQVAVVEDHPMVRERLAQIINAEADLEMCLEAESCEEALRLIRDAQPDLALVDVTLRGGSGLVVITALRSAGFTAPILVLSMHEESLYAERAIRAGANGYITKHRASSEVLSAIRRLLRGEIYLSEKMTSELARSVSRSGKWGPSRSLGRLTERESEVLRLIGQGRTTREIAQMLGVGVASIDTYRARIKEKMNLRNGTELQHFAIRCLADAG